MRATAMESVVHVGTVTGILRDKSGKVIQQQTIHNVVTNGGLTDLTTLLASAGAGNTWMTHIAIGTGNAEAFKTDTILATEIGTRVAGALTSSSNVLKRDATFGAGNGTGTINESGLFDAIGGGTLIARAPFASPFTKGAGDSLQIIWEIQFT